MACRNAYRVQELQLMVEKKRAELALSESKKPEEELSVASPATQLFFGVDSKMKAFDLLQNNLDAFEWVTRNKIYPVFWGRNINGENALSKEEIEFLHDKACKISAIYFSNRKTTKDEGELDGQEAAIAALKLNIPSGTAIFLEIKESENVTTDYLTAFAKVLIAEGFTPALKANTDANYNFDRIFSTGKNNDKETYSHYLIWALSPTLPEYDNITTTHLIHPDAWKPFAPSGITRNEIAVWQYGTHCHVIGDNDGNETYFNINLIRNESVIFDKMF